MSDTTITLRGRVGTDLKVARTERGHMTARFRLAVSHWFASADGAITEGPTRWYTVRAWDRLADNLLHSLRRGDPVIVVGRPTSNAWADAKTGEIRSEVAITAQSVGHDLVTGHSVFTKTKPPEKKEDADAPDQVSASDQIGAPPTGEVGQSSDPLSAEDALVDSNPDGTDAVDGVDEDASSAKSSEAAPVSPAPAFAY